MPISKVKAKIVHAATASAVAEVPAAAVNVAARAAMVRLLAATAVRRGPAVLPQAVRAQVDARSAVPVQAAPAVIAVVFAVALTARAVTNVANRSRRCRS